MHVVPVSLNASKVVCQFHILFWELRGGWGGVVVLGIGHWHADTNFHKGTYTYTTPSWHAGVAPILLFYCFLRVKQIADWNLSWLRNKGAITAITELFAVSWRVIEFRPHWFVPGICDSLKFPHNLISLLIQSRASVCPSQQNLSAATI